MWVTSFAGATVSEVDPKSSRVLGPISVGYGPSAVAVGAGAVWVVNALDGTVSKIDPERSSVVSTLQIGREPQGIAARGNDVWVTDEAGVLTRIDARRTTIAQRVKLGNRPGALALGADGVYVAVRSSGPTHRGGTLRVLAELPGPLKLDGSLDPALAYAIPNLQIVDLLNDGLLAYRRSAGPAGVQIVPDLATSVPNPTDAGRTWTFQLRRGIRYSNGETVLASDIRRAIERGFSLEDSTASFLLTTIEGAAQCPTPPRRCDLSRGIQADDAAGTVTFRLTEPDPDFLYKLAYPTAAAVPRSTPFRAMPAWRSRHRPVQGRAAHEGAADAHAQPAFPPALRGGAAVAVPRPHRGSPGRQAERAVAGGRTRRGGRGVRGDVGQPAQARAPRAAAGEPDARESRARHGVRVPQHAPGAIRRPAGAAGRQPRPRSPHAPPIAASPTARSCLAASPGTSATARSRMTPTAPGSSSPSPGPRAPR